MDVAAGNRVADPHEVKTSLAVALWQRWPTIDQGGIIHGTKISRNRLQFEIEPVIGKRAMFDNDLGDTPLPLCAVREIRSEHGNKGIAVAANGFEPRVDGNPHVAFG